MRQQCSLILTNHAKEQLEKLGLNEHFFDIQGYYAAHIEREQGQEADELKLKIIMSSQENAYIEKVLPTTVIIMHCLLKEDGLLLLHFHQDGLFRHPHLQTNYRLSAKLKFITANYRRGVMTQTLKSALHQLPIAKERSEYVQKRIAGWEGYLKIQEDKEKINDIACRYQDAHFNESFTQLTVFCPTLTTKQLKKLEDFGVSLDDHKEIGQVVRMTKQRITISLNKRAQHLARKQQLLQHKKLRFSNRATLIQLQRLRLGFQQLADGLAVNPHLEQLLFDKKPEVAPLKTTEVTFHNDLNEFQQLAVTGALNAEDIFLIQGPPGTGKTTVIAEICLQSIKRGERTLIASQSNLAVDNALGRLLKDEKTRILRFGRTESIEEEGRPFIEENVGYYWLEQTTKAMETAIQSQPAALQQQKHDLQLQQEQIEQLQQQLQEARQALANKQQAEQQLQAARATIARCNEQFEEIKERKQQIETTQQQAEQQFKQLLPELDKLIEQKQHTPLDKITAQIIAQTEHLQALEQAKEYAEVKQAYDQLVHTKQFNEVRAKQCEEALQYTHRLTTPQHVKRFFMHYELSLKYVPSYLGGLLKQYGQLNKQQTLLERIQKAVTVLFHAYQKQDKARQEAKRLQQVPLYFTHEKMTLGLQAINAQREQQAIKHWEQTKIWKWLQAFLAIRQFLVNGVQKLPEVETQLTQMLPQLQKELEKALQQEMMYCRFMKNNTSQQQLTQLEQQLATLTKPTLSIKDHHEWQVELTQSNEQLQQLQLQEMHAQVCLQRLQAKENQIAELQAQIQQCKQQTEDNRQLYRQLKKEGKQAEQQIQQMKALLETDPTSVITALEQQLAKAQNTYELLDEKRTIQPVLDDLQQTWLTLLQEATDADVHKIRELYVAHANIIGTTCVASARKEFAESYRHFDTVIIDEVSKATPPELLLPMLKGKKVILVGDHHQLPPLLGDDTLEETIEQLTKEQTTFDGKKELTQLLKESLFERLFKSLPATNKQMLAIQYRMHDQIMQGIAPFYAHEAGGLQCGLTNSDEARDHKLTTSYFGRQHHFMWIDTPAQPPYFEQRMTNGTSRFNEGELHIVENMLVEMNEATAVAKQNGLLPQETQKSVGVISFYGEQVKRITKLVQMLNLPHLSIRTGTVDKFQGMEMDIVMVSMVRNTQQGGDVGFAKDYRRLNVALSRARQLLMLIGNTEMFTTKAKQQATKEMYSTLKTTVERANGLVSEVTLV